MFNNPYFIHIDEENPKDFFFSFSTSPQTEPIEDRQTFSFSSQTDAKEFLLCALAVSLFRNELCETQRFDSKHFAIAQTKYPEFFSSDFCRLPVRCASMLSLFHCFGTDGIKSSSENIFCDDFKQTSSISARAYYFPSV